MSDGDGAPAREAALILAPNGRDAAILSALLGELGLDAASCDAPGELAGRLGDETRVVLMTEEAARSADLATLARWIERQPPWSDMPFVVLTSRGGGVERNPAAARLQAVLGNVTFVERPFHPTTLASAIRTADRARRRQYEARARLAELQDGEERLQRLADTLEDRVDARTAELAERTAERDRVWRASTDLYVVMGRDGLYRATNPAWESELGHAASDLVGLRYDDLVHPDDRGRLEAAWGSVQKGQVLADLEIRMRAADGSYRWYEWTGFMDGEVAIGVGRDVEERRAREAELRETEEALRQSQKLEMIGQLTGGIAHDFNNLLMAVQSSVEMARKRLGADQARERDLLDNALRGVARGAALTQRMLAFARKQDLAAGAVDVAALVGGMDDLLSRSLGPQVEIETAFAPGLPPAHVDANQLEMAILNLAVNARDAMEGGGRLHVAVAPVDLAGGGGLLPGCYVRLTLRDTGTGMDADTLARAREPFFTTKGVGKGTGLGLSMVHGLAEQSGGAFRLESVPGRGTVAEILLPSADVAVAAMAPAGDAPPVAAIGDAATRPLRVLAVDDDALVLMGTEAMIEDLGHEVVCASSGAAALAVIEGEAVDVVVTDQSMPRMTGVELARRIKRSWPDLPIVLASGYGELPEASGDLFVARIAKPFMTGHLEDALRACSADGPT